MNCDGHQKVTATHLQRDAYLYVRQSTLRQVLENTESTQRQYALRQQAVALGWPTERVMVIDSDLGQSGASVADREGFQKMVTEVSLGRAGIVLGLEVSRLARNNADWHRLLEICALSDTLILDEDGLYDPGHFNDRLLLGLKGTMSEAELHVLRARLEGGIQSKARRGELKMRLPTGLVYDENDRVVLDPDRQVQQSFFTFFETFERTGASLRDGKVLPPAGPAVAATPSTRPEERRGRVDGAGSLTGATNPAQSALRWCILPRPHSHSQRRAGPSPCTQASARAVGCTPAEFSPWIYQLGTISTQPTTFG